MKKLLEKELKSSSLWGILVETVKTIPNFEAHKIEVRDEILPKRPDITAEELSRLMAIPLGEALVILDELRRTPKEVEEEISKPAREPSHKLAALGGTFSKTHYGHLMLLSVGIRSGRKVVIGVTTDEFAKTLGKEYQVPPFKERVKRLKNVLAERGWLERCNIVPLDDPYGVTVEDPDIEVLVTSPFTHFRGVEINEVRVKRGMKPLEIVVCPLVLAWDGKPISSTRIFRGEIDEKGNVTC